MSLKQASGLQSAVERRKRQANGEQSRYHKGSIVPNAVPRCAVCDTEFTEFRVTSFPKYFMIKYSSDLYFSIAILK